MHKAYNFFLLLLLACNHIAYTSSSTITPSPEQQLITRLLLNYNPQGRPVLTSTDAIEVVYSLEPRQLIKVDPIISNLLQIQTDVVLTWRDAIVKWNASVEGIQITP